MEHSVPIEGGRREPPQVGKVVSQRRDKAGVGDARRPRPATDVAQQSSGKREERSMFPCLVSCVHPGAEKVLRLRLEVASPRVAWEELLEFTRGLFFFEKLS